MQSRNDTETICLSYDSDLFCAGSFSSPITTLVKSVRLTYIPGLSFSNIWTVVVTRAGRYPDYISDIVIVSPITFLKSLFMNMMF